MIGVRKTVGLAAIVALGVVLAGCGSDTTRTANTRAALGAVKQVAGAVRLGRGGQGTAAQPDLARQIGGALRATDGPVALIGVEAYNTFPVAAPVSTNAGIETWKTADKRSFAFQQGVLVSTRGFGEDLMSSTADRAVAMITGRQAGQAERRYNFLSGTGATTELRLACRYATSDGGQIAVAEINSPSTQVIETCQTSGLSVQNVYWVSPQGRILKSRQWVSQGLGWVIVQPLRF